jgi:Cof subfamily protein (haloacid dehalogenase superfamily)
MYSTKTGETEDMTGIKLIVADLDNTLLRRDKTISEYTADVFRRLRECGVLTAFATSRSMRASERFRKLIIPDINIASSGAVAEANERRLFRAAIDIYTATAIIADLKACPEVLQITVDTEDYYFTSEKVDKNWADWTDFFAQSVSTDFSEPLPVPDIFKITPNVTSEATVQKIISRYPNLDYQRFSGEDWYQIKSHQTSKHTALVAVCRELNIALSQIVAFGDDYSDIEMLTHCGVGVAMSNAIDECKAAADYVCGDCDDDGVARWLEENVL